MVEDVAEDVNQGRAAAGAITMGRGAYGVLCQLIPALLEPVQDSVIDSLRVAADSLHDSALELRAAAYEYSNTDRHSADLFGRSQARD